MPRPRKSFDTGGVKSATRVLALLELFDSLQRPAGVTEIARALGIPQSSTSMLVNGLVDLGYLAVLPDRRVQPTQRVSVLGRWIDDRITDGRVSRLMEDLGVATGETILLGIASDVHVVYIAVRAATRPMRLHIPPGTRRPLAESGMGLTLLSAMAEDEIDRRIARAAAVRDPGLPPLAPAAIHAEITAIRAAAMPCRQAASCQGPASSRPCFRPPPAPSPWPLASAARPSRWWRRRPPSRRCYGLKSPAISRPERAEPPATGC